ncbi:MAG: hypothetical protein U1C74_02275 [Phenylobacterium sp.]|nr:hypothetical protein [Phenylobacterium sp.]
MKSLIETYDHHLKMVAAVPPAQRMSVSYKVMFPWALMAMAAFLLVGALGLPRTVEAWIILPTTCVAVAGTLYSSWRLAKHGWQFDRTPTDRVLREMPGADALIQALQRVTLNGLSNLTPSTRLQADLKLTPGDISQLLGILSAENLLDAGRLERMKSGDMTVEVLLQNMSPT